MADTVASTVTSAAVPLRRNLRFQAFWAGSASATLGQAVGDVAYPLAIVTMTGSPGRAALFSAAAVIGLLAASLPAGALADRYDSQRLALAAHAARAAVACVVAIALAGGWLSLPLLLVAAATLGAGQALGSASSVLLLRAIVPAGQLTLALTQDEVRINGATLVGPALAGALYGLRHAAPFAFTAVVFVLAVAATALLRSGPARPAAPARAGGDGGMLAGLRELWGQPLLRATALLIMGINTVGAGLDLVIIVILRHQGAAPWAIGLALGAGAAGGLAGAPLVGFLHRLRPGVLLLAAVGLEVPVLALLAIPLGPWWAAGLLLVSMLSVPALRVLADVLVIRQAPPERRGRVIAALMTLIALGAPAGLVGCGLLLQYLPAQVAMLALAAAMAAVAGYGLSRPELRRARWPRAGR
ncbi:MAG TPA: MFS transporter [Trebonia sp.]|nr:MFS transporter [Trebonia sp.]